MEFCVTLDDSSMMSNINILSNHGTNIYKELVGKELHRAVSEPKVDPSSVGGAWSSSRDPNARRFDCPYRSGLDKPLSSTCFEETNGGYRRVYTSKARTCLSSFKTVYSSHGFKGDIGMLDSILRDIRDEGLAAADGKLPRRSSTNSIEGDLDIYPAWNRNLPHKH